MITCLLLAAPSLFVGYCKLVVQEFKHHPLQSAWCLADGLFEDRLEWLVICLYCNVLLPVQISVPLVRICNDCETFLFDLHELFFSGTQSMRGKTYRLILL